VELVRGNIDTRLRKRREGQFDAVVLAAAGLRRTALFEDSSMSMIEPDVLLPAPGQGALALQCRKEDAATRQLLAALNDGEAAECVAAERALVAALEGDCHSPIAALATVGDGMIFLRAAVGARDGNPPVIRAAAAAARAEPLRAVEAVMETLARQGARELLRG
jgi:hydroxymethylbilane synthase